MVEIRTEMNARTLFAGFDQHHDTTVIATGAMQSLER